MISVLASGDQTVDAANARVLHITLPELALSIQPGCDPSSLTDSVIEPLWEVFSCVRDCHRNLSDAGSTILLWSWPGERTDRPNDPAQPSKFSDGISQSLSLLPAVSALLRSMALELDRPILLVSTDEMPDPSSVKDVISFLIGGGIKLGDYSLESHYLCSFEPRVELIDEKETNQHPLGGHILSLGGARGIVAEMLHKLTDRSSHLSVVGRTPLQQLDPELLDLSPQELMRYLMNRHRQSKDKTVLTPRLLQQQVNQLQRQASLDDQLKSLAGSVHEFDYHSVDLLEPQELERLLSMQSMKDVTILINGAGVIQDQSCLTKQKQSFEQVLRTKVAPLAQLLSDGLPPNLQNWISFSSIASKSGNPGQADYAAANEFLNTSVHWFARCHPEIHIKTINWGPWKGSGMAVADVLKAFHARGLGAIEPEAAATFLRRLMLPDDSAVEVSAVALLHSHEQKLKRYQCLLNSSSLWSFHSLPAIDNSKLDQWGLAFHGDVPYLDGHCKNNRAIVPAAGLMVLAADLAVSAQGLIGKSLQICLYVYNGITMMPGTIASVFTESNYSDDMQSGCLNVFEGNTNRPHYKVDWMCVEPSLSCQEWSFAPDPTSANKLYVCSCQDIYSSCLFHSGVMARLHDSVILDIDSDTAWGRARSAEFSDLLGIIQEGIDKSESLMNLDLALIDSLLQLLLVQVIETKGFSALPQELDFLFFKPLPCNQEVLLTVSIIRIHGACLEAVGACCNSEGELLFVMNKSKFTISKDLLDFQPGIKRPLELVL